MKNKFIDFNNFCKSKCIFTKELLIVNLLKCWILYKVLIENNYLKNFDDNYTSIVLAKYIYNQKVLLKLKECNSFHKERKGRWIIDRISELINTRKNLFSFE